MLTELHTCIQTLIYDAGRIDPSEVDIVFDVPTREWIEKLVRPTVAVYLLELEENTELRNTQYQTTRVNGRAEFRQPPRRIDLRYMVTVLTSNPDDAFRLLWRVLGVMMRTPELPIELLPEDLKLEAPIVARVAQPDGGVKLLDVWSALGTEPRPSFGYTLTAPVDLGIGFDAPLVLSRTLKYRPLDGSTSDERRTLVRGLVRDPTGAPLEKVIVSTLDEPTSAAETDAEGAFTLRAPHAGKIAIRVTGDGGRTTTAQLDLDSQSVCFDLVLE